MRTRALVLGLAVCLSFGVATLRADDRTANSPGGVQLATFLDSLDVEHRWLAHQRVDWETGATAGPSDHPAHATHCSLFVAAACQRLGVPMLHPPDHPQKNLANAQSDWLAGQGPRNDWREIGGAAEAQALANDGQLVVAVFKNPQPEISGHIAIVRPSSKTADQLAAEGPDIIQAGGHNYRQTNLRNGFRAHPGAFEKGQIAYFVHPLAATKNVPP